MTQMIRLFAAASTQPSQHLLPTRTVEQIVSTQDKQSSRNRSQSISSFISAIFLRNDMQVYIERLRWRNPRNLSAVSSRYSVERHNWIGELRAEVSFYFNSVRSQITVVTSHLTYCGASPLQIVKGQITFVNFSSNMSRSASNLPAQSRNCKDFVSLIIPSPTRSHITANKLSSRNR